jgi:hypothetical protein
VTAPEPGGLAGLTATIDSFRAHLRPRRLVVRCDPAVARLLAGLSPRAEVTPEMQIEDGTGLSLRSVEYHPTLPPGSGHWQLLEDGEIVAEGTT